MPRPAPSPRPALGDSEKQLHVLQMRTAMDDTGRLQLARQLLRERTEDYRPARRLFVLLFGQRVSHLAVLARTAMMADDGRVSLALSDIPIRLREPLAGLALEVAKPPPAALRVPSSQGNRPLSPERPRERLAHSGSAASCWPSTVRSARSPASSACRCRPRPPGPRLSAPPAATTPRCAAADCPRGTSRRRAGYARGRRSRRLLIRVASGTWLQAYHRTDGAEGSILRRDRVHDARRLHPADCGAAVAPGGVRHRCVAAPLSCTLHPLSSW